MKPRQLIKINRLITRLQKAIDAGLTYAIIEDDKIKVVYPNDHIQDLAPLKSKEKLKLPPRKAGEDLDEPVHSQDHWRDDFMDEGIITKGKLMKMISENTDYGYLHPAVVTELYNTLADNDIFLEPEGDTYGDRYFFIRYKDGSGMEISINYTNDGEPTLSIYSDYGKERIINKRMSMSDGIELILSKKDNMLNFDAGKEMYQTKMSKDEDSD
jgi:hypothetical protein